MRNLSLPKADSVISLFPDAYARHEWQEECASWRAIIQLNLIRNVNTVLDLLSDEMARRSVTSTPSPPPTATGAPPSSSPIAVAPTGVSRRTSLQPHHLNQQHFTEKHRFRLGPRRGTVGARS